MMYLSPFSNQRCRMSTTSRGTMKSLIQSLQHFSKTTTQHVELFRKLTLRDLGIYVSGADAAKYTHDKSYPLEDKAFLLKNALYQCHYDNATSRFVPRAWKASPDEPLGCSTLYQDEEVTLCWFVIPPGRVLPLHDHPGMTVWQRVMYGRLHICTMVSEASVKELKTADTTAATVVYAGEVDCHGESISSSHLLTFGDGDGGVLHEIRNADLVKPALFVDIIAPPYYQTPSNISCGYYRAEPVREDTQRYEKLPEECGVHWMVKAGDKVVLHPRPDYAGPAMNAYVHVGGT